MRQYLDRYRVVLIDRSEMVKEMGMYDTLPPEIIIPATRRGSMSVLDPKSFSEPVEPSMESRVFKFYSVNNDHKAVYREVY